MKIMNYPKEARIIINDQELTYAQSMTLRVAIQSFHNDLDENGLGEDDIGKDIFKQYQNNLNEIVKKLML